MSPPVSLRVPSRAVDVAILADHSQLLSPLYSNPGSISCATIRCIRGRSLFKNASSYVRFDFVYCNAFGSVADPSYSLRNRSMCSSVEGYSAKFMVNIRRPALPPDELWYRCWLKNTTSPGSDTGSFGYLRIGKPAPICHSRTPPPSFPRKRE